MRTKIEEQYAKAMAVWQKTTAYWPPEHFRRDNMIAYALENVVDAIVEDQENPDSEDETA